MGSYKLKETSSGKQSLIYVNSREVRIHSAYDPEKEADRAVSGFDPGRSSVIVVSGIGLGYHVSALKQRFPDKLILAVEHDREVITIAGEICPEHLEGTAVINSRGDLSSVFEEIDMSRFKGVAHYPHRPSYSLYPEFYDSLLADMQQYISSKVSDLLTRFEFEKRWIENIFSNIHHIYSCPGIISLFGKFKGYPGIIVSAGPSLRRNVDMLKKLRDHALIVSVDTAFKVLQKKGVSPHIVLTLDAQKYSIKHFLGMRDEGAVLLADLVSYPPVMRDFKGRRMVSTTSKFYTDSSGSSRREATPAMDWFEQFIPPVGDIQSGGSVATSAFDLLLNLGCSPIVLIGQDLAYTGREIHCSGTYHNDDWMPQTTRTLNLDTINQRVIRRRKMKYVPAYGGDGEVISDFVFDLYRGWFEDSASKVKTTVINATEGGARIANTQEKPLSSLARAGGTKGPAPADIIKKAFSDTGGGDRSRLLAEVRRAVTELRQVRACAETARDDQGDPQALDGVIGKSDIGLILEPLIRKARTYMARHEGATVDDTMLVDEIISATDQIIPVMERCADILASK